jgi:23S rRNA pseudouridine1911/1915/1917 synthase
MEPSSNSLLYHATSAEEGVRLDVFLAQRLPDVSRAQIQRWIEAGYVELNGKLAKPNTRLKTGDEVYLEPPTPTPVEPQPEAISLQVLYEDEHLAVVNKPRGMVTHPAPGAETGTLVNAALARFGRLSSIGAPERPGIVHRLDKDTTGLILIARTDLAHRALAEQIQQRLVERRYLALVWGVPRFQRALVDAPIGRSESDRTRMSVKAPLHDPSARPAVTEFALLESLGVCALAGGTITYRQNAPGARARGVCRASGGRRPRLWSGTLGNAVRMEEGGCPFAGGIDRANGRAGVACLPPDLYPSCNATGDDIHL